MADVEKVDYDPFAKSSNLEKVDFDPFAKTGRQKGEELPTFNKSVLNVLQGPSFGFGDEIIGGMGGVRSYLQGQSFTKGYEDTRDLVRGAVESHRKEYPISSMIGNVSGSLAMLPTIGVKSLLGAGAVGAGMGGLSGVGEGKTGQERFTEGLKGAATGGALSVAPGAGGAVVRTFTAPWREKSAIDVARRRIAEALQREGLDPRDVKNALDQLPDEAVLADATGENAMNLLKTVVQQPGKSAPLASKTIENRQMGRADRLQEAAAEGLSPAGKRLSETVAELRGKQELVAAPLYKKLETVMVPVTPEIQSLVSRARIAFNDAKKLAGIKGEDFTIPEVLESGGQIPLRQLDTIKRSLFDLEEATRSATTGRLNETGNAIKDLRRSMVDQLDVLVPDYKKARDAFAGPAQMEASANLGMKSINQPDWKIKDLTDGMSASELEAFKIGAYTALKEKFGNQAGQTAVLKMWRDKSTKDRLKEIFGGSGGFVQFEKKVIDEAKMRELESIRGGSDTFSKLMQNQDTAERTAIDLGTGGVASLIPKLPSIWSQMKTPENVRNEIGRILLSRKYPFADAGPVIPRNEANMELGAISRIIEKQRKANTAAGKTGGLLSQQF